MFWIFLLGIIALAAYHRGFRKQLIWLVPVGLFIWFLIAV